MGYRSSARIYVDDGASFPRLRAYRRDFSVPRRVHIAIRRSKRIPNRARVYK